MSNAPLMLSVSGLRGLVGRSLTPVVAARYGAAVGQWFKTQHGKDDPPRIVVGCDSRPSGAWVESAVVAGLASVDCRVTRLGILTTPGVAIMTEHLSADGGIVITASHNPIEWNGVKTLRRDGVAPPADQAQVIIDTFHNDAVDYAAGDAPQQIDRDDTGIDIHAQRILQVIDTGAIKRREIKAVVDSVHGAGGPEARRLLNDLGVELIHLYAEPTGHFPHTPEPTRENLTELCDAVREHDADVGFAQDPDADRLAVVDNRGRYIGEEYTLALATAHVLSKQGSNDALSVAANLSTSRMIDDIAQRHGATVVRTPVGEANVAAAMREHGCAVGGEGNGGVIWPTVVNVRDSLVGMALILEMLANDSRPLADIVDAIPSYAIVKEKSPIQPELLNGLRERLASAFPDAAVDDQDGVRLDWPDRWVHVRPSNTEPILRIIAEAPRESDAQELASKVGKVVGVTTGE